MSDCSPATYLKFADERTRAARDLLAQVRPGRMHKVVDVGCGPGNSTELLVARYPEVEIVGIDNSPAMLTEARRRLPHVRFELADAAAWTPDGDIDLVFANATYQWIPRHLEQLLRVLSALRSEATLAAQMPDNLAEPTHRLMSEVAMAGPWSERLAGAARDPLPSASRYYELLIPQASRLDLWRTLYYHPLRDASAIVEFVRATGLRPFLDPLSEQQRGEFLALYYTARVAAAYPALTGGHVLLPFPRLFLIAERASS